MSPKIGFPGAPKRRNFFAEVAISSSGKPRKTWISRYIETAERIRETRDFELRGTGQNLDFEVQQNSGIRWWGVANSESGESAKTRHFRTIKRWNLVREAPISTPRNQPSRPGRPQSAEPVARKRTFRSADRSGRPRRLNRGPSKCGNLLTEVAKNWIPRRPKTAEFLRGSRDFELREAPQNLDFQVHRNTGTYSRNSRFRAPGNRPKLGFRGTSKQGNTLVGRRSFGIRGICQNPPFPDHKTVEFGAESPDFEPRGTSHPDPEGPNRPNRGPGNGPFDPRIGLAGRVA